MTRSDMPRRVYLRHGAYYFVTLDGKWLRLSAQRDGLPAMYRALANLTEREVTADRMPAVISRWLDNKRKDWTEKNAADQERVAAEMSEAFADTKPSQVKTKLCAEYLRRFEATPRTHNLHRTMLRGVLAMAAVDGLRDGHNPVDDIERMSTPGRARVVTDAEIAALKAAALKAKRNGAALVQMIDLALLTGQRIGDLIGMRWQDVTKDGVYVRQGKTGERLLIVWSPALRKAIKACQRGDKVGHVLKTQSGAGYSYFGIRSAWVRACERAGIEDLNIHDLRGRAGVDAMGEDEDIRSAQRLLGHKGEAMTRHYVDGKYAKKVKPAR
ncbi:MAG: tyrosine-type recombinase/integrase [Mycobacterium sp.]|nr:tyrosine-type recombinase/integrase [Mycobacterium sp.]